MKVTPLLFTFLLFFSLKSRGQDTLFLQNPSFETASANCSEMPAGWINRGSKEASAPSVQPGCLEVSIPAYHGRQYLSLVTRKNGDCDIIGQKLQGGLKLKKDTTYRIRLYLAHSENLEMPKKSGKRSESFRQPAVLQLWGVHSKLGNDELLAVTPPIKHSSWKGYDLIFRPGHDDYDEIQFEVAFSRENPANYNGNILIDSISAIVQTEITAQHEFNTGAYLKRGNLFSLTNPSFEDYPKCCETPRGWYDCSPPDESPPDIQPGSFLVSKAAYAGNTYLGMVVRDNDTWEGVSQQLPQPLQAGESYLFEAYLARAEQYLSLSRATGEEVNYATPVKFRIWGGSKYCTHEELLAESPLITDTQWNKYQFNLTPRTGTYQYLTLEAYYKEPKLFPYNGNLLVDNIALFTTLK